MTFESKIVLFFALCAILCACSDDNGNPAFPIERTISDISIAKRCKDASLTTDSSDPKKCYLLRWQHPYERKDLQSYYIWIDTTVVSDSAKNPSQEQINGAAAAIPYIANDRRDGDTLDLTDMVEPFLQRDSLHIAIWAKYGGSDKGVIRHFYAHFGDDIEPSIVNFSDSASASAIYISWMRPTDQFDFYLPEEINGAIAGYNITVQARAPSEDISRVSILAKLDGISAGYKRDSIFEKESRKTILKPTTNANPRILRFAIADGEGFDMDSLQANQWRLEIHGLQPEHSYDITIAAWDSAGNYSETKGSVTTTDSKAPSIANEFWFYRDSGDGLPRLDSNRLVLFWKRSVDTLDCCIDSFRDVKGYSIEQWNGEAWEEIPRVKDQEDYDFYDYYGARYSLENDSMAAYANGEYISDTLRWVAPGEEVTLRLRAVDSSGHYSRAWISSIVVSKGELWQAKCPQNFAAVRRDSSSYFCMEKLQHAIGGAFGKNVLYREAKQICEDFGKAAGYEASLCAEEEWNAACNSGGSSYGVIEERDFSPSDFLFRYCGVGTKDSVSANSPGKRNKICSSPDGVRDLPGQLQEWAIGKGNSGEEIPLLKGSSYAYFDGASRVELAQCKNRAFPTLIRPRYTTDTVWIYRSGYRADTLFERDTLRAHYGFLAPDSFSQTILIYDLKSSAGDYIGMDYIDQAEYNRRGGERWLEALWQGFEYELKERLPAYISGSESMQVLVFGKDSIRVSDFYLNPTIGFRCCANGL